MYDDEVVRQGKDNRVKRPLVPLLSCSSIDRIDANKKRKFSAFSLALMLRKGVPSDMTGTYRKKVCPRGI